MPRYIVYQNESNFISFSLVPLPIGEFEAVKSEVETTAWSLILVIVMLL